MSFDQQQSDRDPSTLDLHAADLELVADLVAKSCSAPRLEEICHRRQELLTAIASHLAISSWLCLQVKGGDSSSSPVELEVVAEGSWSSATQRSAVLVAFEALANSNEAKLLRSAAQPSPDTITRVRSELVTCPGWRELAESLSQNQIGDFVICGRIRGPQQIHLWVGFRAADASPFTPRERAIVSSIYAAVEWLPACGASAMQLPDVAHLPQRVREAFHHFRRGKSPKEIAEQMGISHHTVGDYFKHIYRHFGVNSGRELLALLLASGELSPGNSESE